MCAGRKNKIPNPVQMVRAAGKEVDNQLAFRLNGANLLRSQSFPIDFQGEKADRTSRAPRR